MMIQVHAIAHIQMRIILTRRNLLPREREKSNPTAVAFMRSCNAHGCFRVIWHLRIESQYHSHVCTGRHKVRFALGEFLIVSYLGNQH